MASVLARATAFLVEPKRRRLWLWVWLPFTLLCLLPTLLSGRWNEVVHILTQGVVAFCVSLIKLTKTTLYQLFFVVLCTLVILGFLGQAVAPYLWLNSERHGIISFLSSLREDSFTTLGTRSWRIPQTIQELELSFEAKLITGTLGWQWLSSSGGYRLEPLTENGVTFTRVITPAGSDPYLMRTFTLGEAVAGHTFRVDVEMRSPTSIPAEGCRGVWLQAWYEGSDTSCLAVALTSEWQMFSHTWTAPKAATSQVIRVILNDFDGLTYDVGIMKLYLQEGETWQELTPLLPTAPALTTSWQQAETTSGRGLQLSEQWQPYTFPVLKETTMEQFTVSLLVPPGVTLATRTVKLNVPAKPVTPDMRQSYVFGHPNLAGHTVTVLTLIVIALSSSLVVQLFVSILGFVACYFTGSRTAWLVLLVGVAALLWFKHVKKRKQLIVLYSVALLTLVLTWQYLGRLQITSVENPSSRQDIWLTSLTIARDHLWLGIGTLPQTFSDVWFAYNEATTEPVAHAHNVVLEWLVDFGILGGFAILWLFISLFRVAWLYQGLLGIAIVLALFVLNIADVSLFYTWVLVPFILYLNARE
jgi:hypothetical protein